jgi:vacuolar-type H+-ATPase subunit H
VEEVKAVVQVHRTDIQQQNALIQSVLDQTVGHLDRQIEHSQNFLKKLEDLNRGGKDIAIHFKQISKDIQIIHQPFLESVQAIPRELVKTSNQITTDLKHTHKILREKFVQEVSNFVQSHQTYVQNNQEAIQSTLDQAVEQLTHSIKNALAVLYREIEQTNKHLHQNISEEHAVYMQKIDKFQDLLGTFKVDVDKFQELLSTLKVNVEARIEDASKIFEKQISEAWQHYQHLLQENEETNKEIQEQLLQSIKRLQAIISSEFVKQINQHTEQLIKSFATYLDKTEEVSEINKLRSKLINDTFSELGFSPRKEGVLEKFKNLLHKEENQNDDG